MKQLHLAIVVLLILNLILFGMGVYGPLVFWAIILGGFLYLKAQSS